MSLAVPVRRRGLRLFAVAALTVAPGFGVPPLGAATVTVTGPGDTVAVDGAVTLREAMESIEAGAAVNADVAAGVTGIFGTDDTIVFGAGSTGTITLTTYLPPITGELTISGPGTGELTISGGSATSIFFVDSGSAVVTIEELTLQAGLSRGGDGGDGGVGGGGGGAAGMGGALFVNTGDVHLTGVNFLENQALGGTGGSSADTGGFRAPGGGGFGEDGDPPTSSAGGDGGGGGPFGATGGQGGTVGISGGATAGGDGGGGGGGGTGVATAGATGGFAGGAGGAGTASCGAGPAGSGGFGGGGGGGTGGLTTLNDCFAVAAGGAGGAFGGDGGDGVNDQPDSTVVVGGGGGGGAGLGGAVFVRSGSVTVTRGTFRENGAAGGAGGPVSTAFGVPGHPGSPGQGKAGAIFVGSGGSVELVCNVLYIGNTATDDEGIATDNTDVFVDPSGTLTDLGIAVGVVAPAGTTGTTGIAFSDEFTASGGTGPYTFALVSGTLPAGIALAADGTLSGTPTEAGSFPIAVHATDADGCRGTSATYTLTISCPAISVAASGSTGPALAGVPFSDTFTASGSAGPHTFTLASGTLPPGITLATDGTLSGTSTELGIFPITVQAADGNACTGTSSTYTLAVSCPPISVTAPAVTAATAGIAFSEAFAVSGGIAPHAFGLDSGTLPSGMTLAADGTLAGTPTESGSFPITVRSTDDNGCSGIGTTYELTVAPGAGASVLIAGGSGQATLPGTDFPLPLVAQVSDDFGNPVPGLLVTFTAVPGPSGASALFPAGATATTDAQGLASVGVRANGADGSHTVEATLSGVGGVAPAVFDLVNRNPLEVPALGLPGVVLLSLLLAAGGLVAMRRG